MNVMCSFSYDLIIVFYSIPHYIPLLMSEMNICKASHF